MIWDYFIYFALVAALLWIAGAYLAWRNRLTQSVIATSIGLVVFFAYILIMWITLERPPMRYNGRDTTMVFVLSSIDRNLRLQSL